MAPQVRRLILERHTAGGDARLTLSASKGWAMLSSVLRSDRAVKVNIAIMRTFVRVRELLLSNADLAWKLEALESKYDAQFRVVFDAIRQLMSPEQTLKRRIGFKQDEDR